MIFRDFVGSKSSVTLTCHWMIKHILLYDVRRTGKKRVLSQFKALIRNSFVDSTGSVDLAWINADTKNKYLGNACCLQRLLTSPSLGSGRRVSRRNCPIENQYIYQRYLSDTSLVKDLAQMEQHYKVKWTLKLIYFYLFNDYGSVSVEVYVTD
jgi:hypothetical protein